MPANVRNARVFRIHTQVFLALPDRVVLLSLDPTSNSFYLDNKRGRPCVLVLERGRDLSLEFLGELGDDVVVAPPPAPSTLTRLEG